MKYVRNTRSPSRMNALWPCHWSTPRSTSKLSLMVALEQIEQAYLALGSVELVLLLHRHPRHPSTLGGQRVTGAGQGLLLHEELLARNLPLLRRHDRRCFHSAFPALHFLLACCHIISPLFSCRQLRRSLIAGRPLRHESGELALKRLGYPSAPALRDGPGRGIGEDLLFAFFQAVEDAYGYGLSRDFRYVEAAVHIGVHGAEDDCMDRHALAGQERSQ